MAAGWERDLDRWIAASLIDSETAAAIRSFEAARHRGDIRWPVALAASLGAVLLGSGILLFVSAHWDRISPAARMALVVFLVVLFHAAAAFTASLSRSMAVALHAIGTFCLGAGIALTGQIFNLETHWPLSILLWAAGAIAAWWLLRHWPQAAFVALLLPFWLASEWNYAMDMLRVQEHGQVTTGLFLLSIAYLGAAGTAPLNPVRRALLWIGGLALLPCAAALELDRPSGSPGWPYLVVGWSVAFGAPLALAFVLRRTAVFAQLLFSVWSLVLYAQHPPGFNLLPGHAFDYGWLALGALGMVAWGLRDGRVERINLGVAGFAIVLLSFYFSTVMDKFGRSLSLIGLGVIFLAGGFILERLRRRLVAQVREVQP